MSYEIGKIRDYIEKKDTTAIKWLMKEYGLEVKDGMLRSSQESKHEIVEKAKYHDQVQHATKIQLNSLYGSLLNKGSRFYDARLGQSTTLTGRSITRHMISKTNELVTGTYDYKGGAIGYSDTDSVCADSIIQTNLGPMPIEELFEMCDSFREENGKEYGYTSKITTPSYDPETGKVRMEYMNYVYRHKVSKKRFRVTDSDGNQVEVTEDHSVMVERDGTLVEVKPCDLVVGDISVNIKPSGKSFEPVKNTVKEVEQLENFDDEYVYDIGINNTTPYFFANGILVHNSVYYSAVEAYKKDPSNPLLQEIKPLFDDKAAMVEYYDFIGDQTNASFPEFMDKTFNTGLERGGIIKAGRELVGSKGLFITKKRYAILVYDDEGTRVDIDGKPGKLKIMGLDIKRSDTPDYIQNFLQDILVKVLSGAGEKETIEELRKFRTEFRKKDAWLQGSPKKVNGITNIMNRLASQSGFNLVGAGKVTVPGHVQASINWNKLKDLNNDHYSSYITDGSKVIVCKLRKNNMNMNSIAYPVDDLKVPDWFKRLPFDSDIMEETLIDKKINNLLGVLNWDLDASKIDSDLNDLFSF